MAAGPHPERALFDRTATFLAGQPGVRAALAFGSRARGTARQDSDLDLAIDGQDVDLLQLGVQLSAELGVTLDVVSAAPEVASIPLLEEILRDGVPVYEARQGAVASLQSRILTALETDRPWYAKMRDAYLERLAKRGLDHGQP